MAKALAPRWDKGLRWRMHRQHRQLGPVGSEALNSRCCPAPHSSSPFFSGPGRPTSLVRQPCGSRCDRLRYLPVQATAALPARYRRRCWVCACWPVTIRRAESFSQRGDEHPERPFRVHWSVHKSRIVRFLNGGEPTKRLFDSEATSVSCTLHFWAEPKQVAFFVLLLSNKFCLFSYGDLVCDRFKANHSTPNSPRPRLTRHLAVTRKGNV